MKNLARKIANKTVRFFMFSVPILPPIINSEARRVVREAKASLRHLPQYKPVRNSLEKIIVINTNSRRGGAAKVAADVAAKAVEQGLQATMLVGSDPRNDIPAAKQIQRGRLTKLHNLFLKHSQLHKQIPDLFHLEALHIDKDADFNSADIVHLHNLHSNYFSYLALPKITALKPTVWTLHDTLALFLSKDQLLLDNISNNQVGEMDPHAYLSEAQKENIRAILQPIYEAADLRVVTPSEWLKGKVSQSILSSRRIEVVPNGIDLQTFHPYNEDAVRAELGIPQNKKVLLFIADAGKDNPWKGGEYFAEVYEQLKNNSEYVFVHIGGNATESTGNWINTGYISDQNLIAKYYSAADVFLYTSVYDNLPLVVIEALACGLPVVAFSTGGIPELVKHDQTGYIAKYRDAKDLLHGLTTVLNNEQFLSKASGLARKLTEEKYDANKMADRYIEIYKEELEYRKRKANGK